MRNKTLVAHHRAPILRAAHPPGVPRTHYHYCHSILPDLSVENRASRGTGAGRARPVRGAVCSCATIVGGSPRGILDLMRSRGRGRLGVADGTS